MRTSLSVVIGMYNEKENVEPVTSEIAGALEAAAIPYEIICISNGSTDGTEVALAEASRRNPRIRPIILKEKGYGNAVITGINAARNDLVILVVGDGQTDPKDMLKAYEVMEKTNVDIVKPRRTRKDDDIIRTALVKIYNLLVKVMFALPGWDVDGQPKVVKRDFFNKLNLESKDFFIDTEMMIKTKYLGGSVAETQVNWRPRKLGIPFIANALIATSWQYLKNILWWRIHYRRLIIQKLGARSKNTYKE
ncbi:MAG: Glycosyl transferase family 2 [Parcubacteria group bacterium GW2011_GWA2_47_10b]|uniref:Glycosyltransferase 2-like domain-containing protein n=1 Tax=Candidatus Ryanbacteria bacterium RIFCSPLOWO2_02_FULL_47_14 TaxID=1802129 RepID=A0A1G2GZI0_9BACT|nr:MAG: Glycosyl transferase family 2 [Parcubacteria group bacterium GW2011_GWA2_47_10b]KKU86363.1 MAG: Glycosyl transferase family 2 [Parcubacteria group bacterium GW2011_GWA1_47_9]OGZ55613.1 MAG: hypothetical protein A3J04_00630 [Candidatus Ryanbacteria bacterium RIFCSPLOWO2_02_FULL_47_14]